LEPREKGSAKQANKICDILKLRPSSQVLDLGCGHGNMTIPLNINKKCDCYGLDLNHRLLQEARKRSRDKFGSEKFIEFDIKNLNKMVNPEENTEKSSMKDDSENRLREMRFDAIISIFTSFGYFIRDDDNNQVINSVFKMLNSEGKFLLDLDNYHYFKDKIAKGPQGRIEFQGSHPLRIRRWDAFIENRSRRLTQFVAFNTNSVRSWPLVSVRLYQYDEIEQILKDIGFKHIEVFGDLNFREFDEYESERMVIVAQKT
jgi:SAM-dependent methyltransferase